MAAATPPRLVRIGDEKQHEERHEGREPVGGLCFYVLKSLKPKSKRTYVGYTTDARRRLRQHNGELVGGSSQTRMARPWIVVATVEGFADARQARQFEYRNLHPPKEWGSGRGIARRMKNISKSLEMERVTKNSAPIDKSRVVVTLYEDVGPIDLPASVVLVRRYGGGETRTNEKGTNETEGSVGAVAVDLDSDAHDLHGTEGARAES